jgi:hypothetical protein
MPKSIWVKQYDMYSRFIKVQLMKDHVNFTPENGVKFVFRCQRPDGVAITEDSAAYISSLSRYLVTNLGGGLIQIELNDEALAVPGRCWCDLCLEKDEKTLSTDPFVLEVVWSPAPPDV